MTSLLFVGDVVGEAGLVYLEHHLPAIISERRPDFVVVNAENLAITAHPHSPGNCGMTPELLERLWPLGVDLVTGGNHSWDGPFGRTIHDEPRLIRPLNYGRHAPGSGAAIIRKPAGRLGVMNLVSLTAMRSVDAPLDAFDQQAAAWRCEADWIVVDFHGELATEKLSFAFAVAGQALAVLGTHTHVPTLDTRILEGRTAYVTDVGMTGPGGGIQGYAPDVFAHSMRLRLHSGDVFTFASGPVELGAVLVIWDGPRALTIERIQT